MGVFFHQKFAIRRTFLLYKKIENNKLFSLNIIRFLNTFDYPIDSKTALLPYESGNYILFIFYIDLQKKEGQHAVKQALSHSIEAYCSNNENMLYYSVFFQNTGELSVICSAKDFSHLIHYVNMQTSFYSEILISVIYGNSDCLSSILQVRKDIVCHAKLRQVYNCQTATHIQVLKEISGLESLWNFHHKLEIFLQHSQSGNLETLRLLKTDFLQNKHMQESFILIHKDVLYLYLSDLLNHSFTADTYYAFVQELYLTATEISHPEPVYNFNLTAIKDFIYHNYSKDISISYISEYYNLSSTYFSRLFHEKTGQKYIDFVTEVRMDVAKKMLQNNPSVSVKSVAEAVGYTSVRHFSKIFQKHTGVLPSHYSNI